MQHSLPPGYTICTGLPRRVLARKGWKLEPELDAEVCYVVCSFSSLVIQSSTIHNVTYKHRNSQASSSTWWCNVDQRKDTTVLQASFLCYSAIVITDVIAAAAGFRNDRATNNPQSQSIWWRRTDIRLSALSSWIVSWEIVFQGLSRPLMKSIPDSKSQQHYRSSCPTTLSHVPMSYSGVSPSYPTNPARLVSAKS